MARQKKVKYCRVGDHVYVHVDGRLMRCVACDRPLEHTLKKPHLPCHHCPQAVESARLAAQRRAEEPRMQQPAYHQRLSDGFELAAQAGDGE